MSSYISNQIVSAEQVWAVPSHIIDSMIPKRGYTPIATLALGMLEDLAEHSIVAERQHLEYNQYYRQIIPYCIVKNREGIYSMMRDRGDPRLTKLRSIGVGGHARLTDLINGSGVLSSILHGAEREITEELVFPLPPRFESINGVICNDQGVDSVHLGIVVEYYTGFDDIVPREKESFVDGQCGFVSREVLIADIASYEPWSQTLIRSFNRS